MNQRMTLHEVAPTGVRAVHALEREVRAHLDHDLLELVKLRASMLNGCAFCVDMHGTDLAESGEDLRRLLAVSTWRESPFFTADERAALALTDAVTRLGEHGVDDDVWAAATAAHGEDGTAWLLLAIATINVWNRIAVPTRAQPPGVAAA